MSDVILKEINSLASELWNNPQSTRFMRKFQSLLKKKSFLNSLPIQIQDHGNHFIRHIEQKDLNHALDLLRQVVHDSANAKSHFSLMTQLSKKLISNKFQVRVQPSKRKVLVTLQHPLIFKDSSQTIFHTVEFQFTVPECDDFDVLFNHSVKEIEEIKKTLPGKYDPIIREIKSITNDFNTIYNSYTSDFRRWLEQVQRATQQKKQEQIILDAKLQVIKTPYSALFLKARLLQRKIIFFVGPPNSGKTYQAFNELVQFQSGTYLAPLRLMALEGQEEILKRGIPCSLLTGEEKIIDPTAVFQSSTVEMLNFEKEVEAVLIDEIQMVGDSDRGAVFTAALVGAPAKTILLTGSASALDLIQKLCHLLGESFEVREMKRLTTLKVNKTPASLNKKFEKGTAIIAFSRAEIIGIRDTLISKGYKVSVIYGGLGPEVRKEEARRFRDGETSILVASDAVGMGLNLPIKKIIFFTLFKFNGEMMVPIDSCSIRQIAGRAGRFGIYPSGRVAAFSLKHAEIISDTLSREDTAIKYAFTAAHFSQIVEFMEITSTRFAFAYSVLGDINSSNLYTFKDSFEKNQLARKIDKEPLALKDKFTLIHAPIDLRHNETEQIFMSWVGAIAQNISKKLPNSLSQKPNLATTAKELEKLEQTVKQLNLYRWLHQRYPDIFIDHDEAKEQLNFLTQQIINSLKTRIRKRCIRCQSIMDNFSRHSICDSCHFDQIKKFNSDDDYDDF